MTLRKLRILIVVFLVAFAAPVATARRAPLTSVFFASSPCATAILNGKPYDMNDSKWEVNGTQNRDTCAFKFFSALFMLGYDTSLVKSAEGITPVRVLHLFQAKNGLPSGSLVNLEVLTALDKAVAALEPKLAALAKLFPLYQRVFPLHPNDVSTDTVSAIYGLAFSQLPPEWVLEKPELLRCITGQCVGDIVDLDGKPFKDVPPNASWRYRPVYFDSKSENSKVPRASQHVVTVLHEFAHYIDGRLPKTAKTDLHEFMVDNFLFYRANYLYDKKDVTCAPKRTDDTKDWTTWYGYLGVVPMCGAKGQGAIGEEWAEAMSMYVTSGEGFRVAAAARPTTNGRKYKNIKDLFHGVEFATNLARSGDSGCQDILPKFSGPGYAVCDPKQVFDWQLPKLKK